MNSRTARVARRKPGWKKTKNLSPAESWVSILTSVNLKQALLQELWFPHLHKQPLSKIEPSSAQLRMVVCCTATTHPCVISEEAKWLSLWAYT